jgi:hypothetical protein
MDNHPVQGDEQGKRTPVNFELLYGALPHSSLELKLGSSTKAIPPIDRKSQ